MSVTLKVCCRKLADFSEEQENLPSTSDGREFGSYTLTGPQVGAVRLLLWRARKLEKQNRRLKRFKKRDAQSIVDTSISYLDQHE